MFKINDYVVYKRNVCKIENIIKNKFNNKDYYLLIPIDDASLKIEIPTDSDKIRSIINYDEFIRLMDSIPMINVIDADDKVIELEYKRLMGSDNLEDLIKIIKTTYQKNKQREDTNRKVRDKDVYYFNKAEKCLYNEFSLVLNKNFNETKDYVVRYIHKKISEC